MTSEFILNVLLQIVHDDVIDILSLSDDSSDK